MLTNDFTEAARAEAERHVPAFTSNDYTPNGLTAVARLAHVEGWKAARDYLAAQEPTDAEVRAAAFAVMELDGDRGLDGFTYSHIARAALVAARAARRDEETR